MALRNRNHWNHRVDEIIRSRHYTWLAEGLAGESAPVALADVLTDVMHICARQGLRWENLVGRSRAQFEREEADYVHQMLQP